MMVRWALAVAVLATARLRSSEGYSFNPSQASGTGRQQQSHCCREQISVLHLKSSTTEAAAPPAVPGESNRSSSNSSSQPALSRDSWPASKRRRVKGAIRWRARRLARLRIKNKARQDTLELATAKTVDDVGRVANSTYFPIRRGRRAAAAAAEAEAEAPTAAAVAAAAAVTGRKREGGADLGTPGNLAVSPEKTPPALSSSYASDDDAERPPEALAATSKRRNGRKEHATIKGRPIVKGGKDRGLWRSIFGPRPLLEVHTIDQLSQLVDAEGWGLEDLSVFTGGSGSGRVRATDSAVSNTAAAITADVAVDDNIDGVVRDSAEKNGGEIALEEQVVRGTGSTAMMSDDEDGCCGSTAVGDDATVEQARSTTTPSSLQQSQPRQQQQQQRHPSVQAVLERAAAGTRPSEHGDGRRIGLAIEGGGMRGCVGAGMASCLHFLGLADSFDCVYGSSAGSLIGEEGRRT